MRRYTAIAVVLVMSTTSSAHGQLGFLDKVFARVTDVNAAYLIGRPLKGNEIISDNDGKMSMHGVGFEVAVALGPLITTTPDSTCLEPTLKYETKSRERSSTDTTYIETAVEVPSYPDSIKGPDGEPDPKKKQDYDDACDEEPSLSAELSFGYSQIGGFQGRDLRLQGSLENLPAIGFYAVWSTGFWIDPYIGVRTGLAQLKGFQAFPADTGRVTATGSTWQLGIAPGFSFGKPTLDAALFVEAEWMYRNFEDIQWTSVIGPVPASLRQSTHLSTFVISIGGQIGIGKDN